MRKYTQLDGYRAATGYVIRQDEKGYIWIGSDKGGIRFDGNVFKELGHIHPSSNPEILQCLPLRHDRVACIPYTGDIYMLDHDSVIVIAPKRKIAERINATFYNSQTDILWLWHPVQNDSLYKLKGRDLTSFPKRKSDFEYELVLGNSMIGTVKRSHYIGYYDIPGGAVRPFYHTDGTIVSSITETLLPHFGSLDKLLTYEPQNHLLHIYEWQSGDSVLRELNHFPFPMTFWYSPFYFSYCEAGRHYFFYRKANKHLIYCQDVTDKNALQNLVDIPIPDLMKSFFVDRNNNVWITTAENALYFISAKHIENARMVAHAAPTGAIPKSITGTGDLLCISYPNSNMLTSLTDHGTRHFTLIEAFTLGPRRIKALEDGNIYFYESDIGILNPRRHTINYLHIKQRSIKDVCLYKNGLLAATNVNTLFLKKKNHTYSYHTVFDGRSTAIQVTPSDQILIGTPHGLYQKNGLGGPAVLINDSVLQNRYITHILLTDDSHALVSTGNGLFLYPLNGSALKLKAPNAGAFIPDHIREMYRQDSTTFWAATNEGACVLSFDQKWSLQSVKNYTFYDGLPSNNVTSIYTRRDTAFIATADGLGIVPLQDTSFLKLPVPDLYIDRLQVGPRSITTPGPNHVLPNDSNELRIVLNAISYESMGNIKYYYRLTPIQAEWIETEEPEARFQRLAPGQYVFEAYAVNAKKVKSKVVRLDFYVPPAYWQTLYFRLGIVLLAVILLSVVIRWQFKRGEKKRYMALQQKKHMAELELEAIKAQINPHFISNCLNSIQYLNYTTDYEGAQLYLGRFARLIRLTLQYSRKVFITVEEEIAYLSAYLQMEKLRLKNRLQFSIENELEQGTLIPAMLLQPYVENAFKYGLPPLPTVGNVSVRFRKQGENIEITISDDGHGFSDRQSVEAMGLRLSSTKALTYNELFNMDVTIRCYNKQDLQPEHTGAVVCILIKTNKNGKTNYSFHHHR